MISDAKINFLDTVTFFFLSERNVFLQQYFFSYCQKKGVREKVLSLYQEKLSWHHKTFMCLSSVQYLTLAMEAFVV